MEQDPFKEYIIETEPNKRCKSYAWNTAIGLQAVDGLNTSKYLKQAAIRNIEGEISFNDVFALLHTYYEKKPKNSADRTEEADKVSARIAELLSENSFSFTPNEYLSIHRRLFIEIYSHAGSIRTKNITKKEWVLDGETVLYGSATELMATLEYDISEERKFSYKGLSIDEIIKHLSFFISRLWQIHPFSEGNTRTTAVFFIKYLRTLGFDVTNEIFAKNAWYFRNALVRANYRDLKNNIHETTEYLELFLKNLLLGEENLLQNRMLHIKGFVNQGEKVNIENEKVNIEAEKVNIEDEKVNIRSIFSQKKALHICKLLDSIGFHTIFGRSDMEKTLGLKPTSCSLLIKEMVESGIIEAVSGFGKGRYLFKQRV